MSAESDFNAARKGAQRALDAHESGAISRVLSILDALRLTVIARLAESHLQANDIASFRSIQAMLDSALLSFQAQMERQIRADIAIGVESAVKAVDAPLAAAGIPVYPVSLNPASVEAAQLFALDRVKGLTADARDAIASILRRVLGNAISVEQGIKEVGASLNSKGIFKSFAARAETIVRTEILTVQSQVAQARMELRAKQLVGTPYQLRKAWLDAGDDRVRDSHSDAADDYGKDGDPGPIAIDESFNVGGSLLLYPRDPTGPADETINCRCTSQPVLVAA